MSDCRHKIIPHTEDYICSECEQTFLAEDIIDIQAKEIEKLKSTIKRWKNLINQSEFNDTDDGFMSTAMRVQDEMDTEIESWKESEVE